MKKKNIIRVGDKVKVIIPDFFIRCGYPATVSSKSAEILEQFEIPIQMLLEKLNIPKDSYVFDKVLHKICNELAWGTLKIEGFGGNERQIFTKYNEHKLNKEFIVRKIKRVKTGFYSKGDNEYPPYLSQEKTHKLLHLDNWNGLIIEEKNVIKIHEEENENKPKGKGIAEKETWVNVKIDTFDDVIAKLVPTFSLGADTW